MPPINNNKRIVLVIDDEPDVSAYICMALESNGYRTQALSEVENGLSVIDQTKPDLICLDIMMPGETGISFYQRMRQEKRFDKIPVMIVSGASPDGEFDFRTYVPDEEITPPDYFMEKPINVEIFIEQVNRLISNNARIQKDDK